MLPNPTDNKTLIASIAIISLVPFALSAVHFGAKLDGNRKALYLDSATAHLNKIQKNLESQCALDTTKCDYVSIDLAKTSIVYIDRGRCATTQGCFEWLSK